MAFIGMRYPVAAKITAHTDGSEPTYEAGVVLGHAITGNLTINRNDNPLYGDDTIVEDDNGITSMSLELGTDDLTEAVQEYMLGLAKKTSGSGESAVTTYYDTEEGAPNVGVGYIRVRRLDGVTSYQANWIYKATFSMGSENSQTKGETIEWQTPTITGRAAAVSVDATLPRVFRKKQNFETESAAKAWLDGIAQIS